MIWVSLVGKVDDILAVAFRRVYPKVSSLAAWSKN
jgi:hypothetical protein